MSSSSKKFKNKVTNIVILLFLVIFISFRVSTACKQLGKETAEDPEEITQTDFTWPIFESAGVPLFRDLLHDY